MASTRSFRRARLHAPRRTSPHPSGAPVSLYSLLSPIPEVRPARVERRGARPGISRGSAVAGVATAVASVLSVPLVMPGTASAAVPSGRGVTLNAPIVGVAPLPDGRGYWEVAADGGVFAFGAARFHGSTGSDHLNRPIVGMEATPDGRGYWEVAADGGVFTFGDAAFYGSTGSERLVQTVTALQPTPDGRGYWEVARDGGVFAFGDAGFYGSAAGRVPTGTVVGLAATGDGRGYWEATSGGAVYAFGDARFAGGAPAGSVVVGISAGGNGYRLATSTGGVDDFGGARFFGSAARLPLNRPVIGLASTSSGYVAVGSDGGIFSFGGVGFFGSLGGSTVVSPSAAQNGADADGVTPYQRAAWTRVNLCEEGGDWHVDGPVYSGGLGFSHANWDRFNTFGFPADAADATPDQQIRVAVAFATQYWGSPDAAPDQNGCGGGY